MVQDLWFRELVADLEFFALSNAVQGDVADAVVFAALRMRGQAVTLVPAEFPTLVPEN